MTRDGDALKAFFNVCRHRGHELVPPGESATGRGIKCPYHGWVYGASGELMATPSFDGDVEIGTVALDPARMDTWHDWIFVNTSADAAPLADYVGNLEEHMTPYEPERLVLGHEESYEVATNWKLLVENYHECYHCAQIHPELCRVTPPDSGIQFERTGEWVGGSMDLRPDAATMSLAGSSSGVNLRGLSAEQQRQVLYFELFPTLLLSLHPDYVMTHRIEPLAPAQSRVECRWFFPPESFEQRDFSPAYASDFWHLTNLQDWAACESVQRALGGRGYRPGPISRNEASLYNFITKIARRYLADEGDPASSSA